MATPSLIKLPRRKRRNKPGTEPGTIIADPAAPKPKITLMAYSAEGVEEKSDADAADITSFMARWPLVWVNVNGLGDATTIQALGAIFDLHHLALEDVVNTHQRSKLEEYDEHMFMVVRVVEPGETVRTEQISIFFGENFVLTFQEREGDHFDNLRERIRRNRGKIRQEGADYLVYSFIDAMVDSYFPRLDLISDELEDLELEVLRHPDQDLSRRLHRLRRDLLTVRRAVSPLREAINTLLRDIDIKLSENTRLHLRDCYDHTIQILDLVDSEREIASGLLDIYLTSVSNRMNEVMKVLTVMATVFIPLTFLVGVYGMNFDPSASPWNMPELGWEYGYPVIWAVMIFIVIGELWYFRRKGWIGGDDGILPDEESDRR